VARKLKYFFVEYAITNGVVNGSEAMSKESHENLTSKEQEDSGIKICYQGTMIYPFNLQNLLPIVLLMNHLLSVTMTLLFPLLLKVIKKPVENNLIYNQGFISQTDLV
jgi:hypothetical protein